MERKSRRIYILFRNDIYVRDSEFKIIEYLTNYKIKKAEYPTINGDIENKKEKYNKIWIGYSDIRSDLKGVKDGRLNVYYKHLRCIGEWKSWMEIFNFKDPEKKIYVGIHELEVLDCDDDMFFEKVDYWINEYKRIYSNNVINGNEKPKTIPLVEQKPGVLKVDRSTQTSPQRVPRERLRKFTTEEIQNRYRDKNKEILKQKAKEYYIRKKNLKENPV
jgi:hypothetical protein